ncbi:MAG: endoglucanase, partial [Micromonosporaceae bacterium]|nr:endoglucanase [Micromonosporaceae bacterium]
MTAHAATTPHVRTERAGKSPVPWSACRIVVILALAVTVPEAAVACGNGSRQPSRSIATESATRPPLASAPTLRVERNKIVDGAGTPIRLLGVNRSGSEFQCVHSDAIWDGPVDNKAVAAIVSWHARAVRIALNEDCWLGVHPVHPASSGQPYRQAIAAYVETLDAHGIVAILDLHWSSGMWAGTASQCPDTAAACQKPMPDAAHAPTFWASVAETFRTNLSVVFDVFNEPFPNATGGMTADQSWDCWLRGGSACVGLTYPAAGMQQLVAAIRDTGAKNVVLVSGNGYAADMTKWLAHRPIDPTGNLGAAWHSYSYDTCLD